MSEGETSPSSKERGFGTRPEGACEFGLPALSEMLGLTEPKRPVPSTVVPDQPLISLAWRVLSEERRRLAGSSIGNDRRLDELLAGLALFAFTLEKSMTLFGERRPEGSPQWAVRLRDGSRVIDALLDHHRVRAIRDAGSAYEGELLEVFSNVGQREMPEIETPVVAEVIEPAILRNNALLHMGKAIIGLPRKATPASEEGLGCQKMAPRDPSPGK